MSWREGQLIQPEPQKQTPRASSDSCQLAAGPLFPWTLDPKRKMLIPFWKKSEGERKPGSGRFLWRVERGRECNKLPILGPGSERAELERKYNKSKLLECTCNGNQFRRARVPGAQSGRRKEGRGSCQNPASPNKTTLPPQLAVRTQKLFSGLTETKPEGEKGLPPTSNYNRRPQFGVWVPEFRKPHETRLLFTVPYKLSPLHRTHQSLCFLHFV